MSAKYQKPDYTGDGLKLKNLFDEINLNRVDFCKKIGIHRNTLGTWYSKHTLSVSRLLQTQKIIGFDISHIFPQLLDHEESEKRLSKSYKVSMSGDTVQITKEEYQEYMILKEKIVFLEKSMDQKDELIKTLRENIELLRSQNISR